LRVHQGTPRMADLVAAADLAVGAGGVSALERCCLGLPSIVLQIADNQRLMAASLADAGAIIDLGPADAVPDTAKSVAGLLGGLADAPQRLSEMSRRAFAVCDGRGTWRVALALLAARPSSAGAVTLRFAAAKDAELLFAWQTPAMRRFSRNPRAPGWDEHVAWLEQVLADPDRLLMIIEAGGRAAGMLRLDGLGGTPEVTIAIAPECHGQGVGKAALLAAGALLPRQSFDAFVHPDNSASHGLFRACGYHAVAPDAYRLPPRTDDARH
jgi:UDP-2,4-diacetamido-2,4,6-trideoxy-beta-L-altropyranose hydrolase